MLAIHGVHQTDQGPGIPERITLVIALTGLTSGMAEDAIGRELGP